MSCPHRSCAYCYPPPRSSAAAALRELAARIDAAHALAANAVHEPWTAATLNAVLARLDAPLEAAGTPPEPSEP